MQVYTRFILTFGLMVAICATVQGQTPVTVGEGGGNGGGGNVFTVTITSDLPASNKIVIGNTAAFSYTIDGAYTAPLAVSWEVKCEGGAGPVVPVVNGNVSPFRPCLDDKYEGVFEVKLTVTDDTGASDDDTVDVTVEGPNKIIAETDAVSNASTGAGSVMSVVHKFYAKKDDEEVGPCWKTCGYEWVAHEKLPAKNPPEFEDDPPADVNDWEADDSGFKGCEQTNSNSFFYWHSPYIYDKKSWVDPGVDWAKVPVGAVFKKYKQWVAVRVPICGDPNKTD